MKIIGLDVSTYTGYAVWIDGKMHHGVIHAPKSEGPYADLAQLKALVIETGEMARGADFAVLEDFSFASPMKAHMLGGYSYAVRLLLRARNIPFCRVAPTALKKYCTGSGKMPKGLKKETMIREVFRKWEAIIDDNNEADAYGLCRIGQALLGLQDWELTKAQTEVLAKIAENQVERYEHLLLSHAAHP